MNILSGKYRGQRIKTEKVNKFFRPTTSKTREAIFNILAHNSNFQDKDIFSDSMTCLELFCGSGIFSFEAISRGMGKAILIDMDSKLKDIFYANKSKISIEEDMEFLTADACKLRAGLCQADLCFIDPPYKEKLLAKAMTNLIDSQLLNKGAIIITETHKIEEPEIDNNHYQLILSKVYGNNKISFYQAI